MRVFTLLTESAAPVHNAIKSRLPYFLYFKLLHQTNTGCLAAQVSDIHTRHGGPSGLSLLSLKGGVEIKAHNI